MTDKNSSAEKLDQFYTKPQVAQNCWQTLQPVVHGLVQGGLDSAFFVEPSAGDGVFYILLPKTQRVGLDLDPRAKEILKRNFLKCRSHRLIPNGIEREQVVVIGNPPFGKRGHLAVQFVNKAFTIADTVAFIVPVIFAKHFIHKQIEKEAKLIYAQRLDKLSFRTASKPDYSVNTEFQIWTKLNGNFENLRLYRAPPIAHPDFVMHQYNNTQAALKMFQKPFDFAVPCQGWQNYARRETRAQDCEKHKQWMLFKANNKKVHHRLFKEMNFAELAQKHTTSVPGFRKGDVVQEYTNRFLTPSA